MHRKLRWAAILVAGLLALSEVAASSAPQANLAQPAAHQRLLPLQGGRNFRDLGGYQTTDGRHVKWGVLFRSGSLSKLTPADYAYLEGRGISVVCDLRDVHERAAEPIIWPGERAPAVLTEDYTLDVSGLMPNGPPATWTETQVHNAFAASYPRMLSTFNSQYRRMFAELLAGHTPLAFNCSAGKDRTGIAAALILTALGVPRAIVIEDYTATNRYLDTEKLLAQGTAPANMVSKAGPGSSSAATMLNHMQPGALQAMMAADPGYIKAALSVVDKHPGGAAGYLHDELGLSQKDISKLRDLYLE